MYERLVGRVPKDWSTTTLGELCKTGGGGIQTGPFGSQLHASDYVSSGIPVVMPQNIGDNVINERGIARVRPSDAARLDRHLLRAGDIVYSRRGDVERRALVRPIEDGWLCGTGCLRVRVGNAANPAFISYFLGHPEVRRWIVKHAVGATMPNLNTAILSSVPLILPPRHTQDGIAAVLGVIDDKIALNDRLALLADRLAESVYERTVAVAQGVQELGDLIDLKYGKSLPRAKRRPGRVPVYGSGGVSGSHDDAVVTGPGVIVGRKGTVGSVYWSEVDFFPIDTTYYVSLRKPWLSMEYVYFTIRRLDLRSMNFDSAVPGLNREAVLALPVPIPSATQVQAFTRLTRSLFRKIYAHQAENSVLSSMRDALLPRLMSGELRVRGGERVPEAMI